MGFFRIVSKSRLGLGLMALAVGFVLTIEPTKGGFLGTDRLVPLQKLSSQRDRNHSSGVLAYDWMGLDEHFFQRMIQEEPQTGELVLKLLAIYSLFLRTPQMKRKPTIEELVNHSGITHAEVYSLARVIEENSTILSLWNNHSKTVQPMTLDPGEITHEMERVRDYLFEGEIHHLIKRIGPRAGRLRNERELSQQDLAEKAGLSDRTIYGIENGNGQPQVRSLVQLANGLRVTLNYLLFEEGRRTRRFELNAVYLAPNLRKLMMIHGLNPSQLAKELDEDYEQILRITQGARYPSTRLFIKIMKHFKKTVDHLTADQFFIQPELNQFSLKTVSRIPIVELSRQWRMLEVPDPKGLGERIQKLRVRKYRSARAFAKAIGFSGNWANQIELGKFQQLEIPTLITLANHFQVTLFYLLTGKKSTLPWRSLDEKAFGLNLMRFLKKNPEMKLKKLAKEISISSSRMFRLANGGRYPSTRFPSLSLLIRLAKTLKEPIDNFFIEDDPAEPALINSIRSDEILQGDL